MSSYKENILNFPRRLEGEHEHEHESCLLVTPAFSILVDFAAVSGFRCAVLNQNIATLVDTVVYMRSAFFLHATVKFAEIRISALHRLRWAPLPFAGTFRSAV